MSEIVAPEPPSTRRARRAASSERVPRARSLVALAIGLAGIVAAGSVVDRAQPAAVVAGTDVPGPGAVAPVAPPAASLGSTWYCAGGTGVEDGGADHRVVVANPGTEDVEATVTVFPGALDAPASGSPVSTEVTIRGRSTETVRLADVLAAPFVSALVEVSDGQVAVDHRVVGSGTDSVAPCASRPSSTWYFAAGDTTRTARELLALFNPFPDDAVADLTFTTPEGLRAPAEFDGLVVPASSVLVVDVGAVVARHANVATTIATRSGRLVVDRLQVYEDAPAGTAVTLGASAPALVWAMPDGFVTDGLTEIVTVYNPTERQAEVDLEVNVDDPATTGAVEPFELSIPPRGYVQVNLSEEERVPDGAGHAITARSLNGVPVVAERWVRSSAPAPRTGIAATLGSPVAATEWILPTGSSSDGAAEFLVVSNPAPDTIARVRVVVLAAGQLLEPEGLSEVEIPAGSRVVIDLGQRVNRADLPLVVTANVAVVVERGIFRGDAIAQSLGIPVEDTASILTP